MECNNDINIMIDLAKVADLVSVANLKSWNKQMFLMTIFIYLTSYLMPDALLVYLEPADGLNLT